MPNFLSEDEVMDFIQKVENSRDPYVDTKILSAALKLTYYCALKRVKLSY